MKEKEELILKDIINDSILVETSKVNWDRERDDTPFYQTTMSIGAGIEDCMSGVSYLATVVAEYYLKSEATKCHKIIKKFFSKNISPSAYFSIGDIDKKYNIYEPR